MKQMYLASSVETSASHIAAKIGSKLKSMKVAFIDTAAENDNDIDWMLADKKAMKLAGFNFFDYSITDKNLDQLNSDLGDCDLIHVNGGDTYYLLYQFRKTGFDKFITKQVNNGVIYTGSSAGSIICAPDVEIMKIIESEAWYKKLQSFKGLGLVDFITFPHWGSDDFRNLYLNRRLDLVYKPENKIILLNDFQYVQVLGSEYNIVDIRQD